jgi:hypothetical protein
LKSHVHDGNSKKIANDPMKVFFFLYRGMNKKNILYVMFETLIEHDKAYNSIAAAVDDASVTLSHDYMYVHNVFE